MSAVQVWENACTTARRTVHVWDSKYVESFVNFPQLQDFGFHIQRYERGGIVQILFPKITQDTRKFMKLTVDLELLFKKQCNQKKIRI